MRKELILLVTIVLLFAMSASSQEQKVQPPNGKQHLICYDGVTYITAPHNNIFIGAIIQTPKIDKTTLKPETC